MPGPTRYAGSPARPVFSVAKTRPGPRAAWPVQTSKSDPRASNAKPDSRPQCLLKIESVERTSVSGRRRTDYPPQRSDEPKIVTCRRNVTCNARDAADDRICGFADGPHVGDLFSGCRHGCPQFGSVSKRLEKIALFESVVKILYPRCDFWRRAFPDFVSPILRFRPPRSRLASDRFRCLL
jgi:hypothetical protein